MVGGWCGGDRLCLVGGTTATGHARHDHDPGRVVGGERAACTRSVASLVASVRLGGPHGSAVCVAPRAVAIIYRCAAVDPDLAAPPATTGPAGLEQWHGTRSEERRVGKEGRGRRATCH